MVVVLERQLHAVKINEGDAVQGAFDQLRDLYVKLSAAGVDYPKKIKCHKALSLLPESWGPLVVNLNGMKDSWSLEWIRAQVLQEEFRRKELTAAAGEDGGSAYGMKGFKGCGSKKGKAKEGSGGEQYLGGKRGNKGGKQCGGQCCKVALHRSSHWVIDTGAFMTMINREDLLDDVRPSKAATVISATGQIVPVRGEGRAMFMGADGRLVGLKRVLLVPGLCANLLSNKALSEAGMKMEMMGTKVFKATLDGHVLWGLRGGNDMHRSMWEIPVLPWKEAAARLAAEAVRGGHASHVTSGGGGDGSDGGLLVHGGGTLPSVTPSTGEMDWLTAHRRFGHVALPRLQQLFKEERAKGLTWYFPLTKKSDAAKVIIEEWLPMVERESGKGVKAICSDRGGEFLGAEFRSWLKRYGIKQQLTTAYTPQSNSMAERANRTIIEGGRTVLVDSCLPLRFWPLTIRHATVIKNRVLTHVGGQHWVPMEKWSSKKPLVEMLRVFGCMGLVHVLKEKRDNLQAAAVWAVHLALAGDDREAWLASREDELQSHMENETWTLTNLPLGRKALDCTWVLRVKIDAEGRLERRKTRLVIKSFQQREGIDFQEVFASVAKAPMLRVLLAAAAVCGWKVEQMDVKTAFLYGVVDEEIYMKQPEGYDDGSGRASRVAQHTEDNASALGFVPSTADPSLFLRTSTLLPPFYVLVYVDNLVFATADTEALAHMKSELQKRHTCTDLGKLRSYLGLQITRDRARRTITLTQSHMVHQVLQRFDFRYSSPQSTLLPIRHSLSAPPSDESVEPSGPYPELVGCLITSGVGLVLGGQGPAVLTGHADTSWVEDLATQWSSQGYTFSLGSGSVSWWSTRSSSVLSSSCEAEIYAWAMAAQELRSLTYLLTDLGERPRSSPVLYVDNKAMISLCLEHRLEHRTKHIALRYFLSRELQQRGHLRLAYVVTRANTTYIFAKALQSGDHQRFYTVLGLVSTLPHLLTA
ncbi:unnamed protein product [Closterium sp. NIES-54]